jgi:hypothetical protein
VNIAPRDVEGSIPPLSAEHQPIDTFTRLAAIVSAGYMLAVIPLVGLTGARQIYVSPL